MAALYTPEGSARDDLLIMRDLIISSTKDSEPRFGERLAELADTIQLSRGERGIYRVCLSSMIDLTEVSEQDAGPLTSRTLVFTESLNVISATVAAHRTQQIAFSALPAYIANTRQFIDTELSSY